MGFHLGFGNGFIFSEPVLVSNLSAMKLSLASFFLEGLGEGPGRGNCSYLILSYYRLRSSMEEN